MADARIVVKPNATGKWMAYVEQWGKILASTVRDSPEECEAWVRERHPDALDWATIERWSRPNRP